uniref:receptor protein-tyrosine kinase n=1 Tax=Steinernema glaseri TaxID=37863 RepID=A0A1I7YTZ1_9BILA
MIGSWILLFLATVTLRTSLARRAVLLDTGSATTSLDWDTHTLNSDDKDEFGWLEETYRLSNTSDNKRVYVTCNAGRERGENWLITPRIERNGARRMSIELTFTIRDCLDFPKSAVKCKDSFELYAKQLQNGEMLSNGFNLNEWSFVDFVTGERYRRQANSKQINVKVYAVDMKADAIHFAFRDQGTCVSLLNVQVYYDVCPAEIRSLVQFTETVSGPGPNSFISVVGTCVEHAVLESSANASALCIAGGQWEMVSGKCVCAAGYTLDSQMNGCKACPAGTYKARNGADICSLCPAHSASLSGSSNCTCDAGYFRADEDLESRPCSQPPSKPSQLRVTRVLPTEVTVEWNEPSSIGGRSDTWYRYQCSNCASNVRAVPSSATFKERRLTLSNLEPGTTYSIVVFAENGVSKKAGSAYRQYAVTEFQTKAQTNIVISGLRLESMSNTGVSISWNAVSSVLAGGAVTYEVKMSVNNTGSSTTTVLTYYSFSNLLAGETYAFAVRARIPDIGWTAWTDPLYYNSWRGQISDVDANKQDTKILSMPESPFWYAALVVIILLLVAVLVFLCIRRPTINRKQLSDLDKLDIYKQGAPLMSNENAATAAQSCYSNRFKPYVDPTTYEDPNLALTEFANDIDPTFVTITGSIGSGEFGDVCYGRLSLPSHRAIYGDKVQDQIVAIKTLKKGSSEKARADFLMEASIMGQFDHENVIRLIGVVTRTEPTMIIIEYMLNGSLDQYLRRHDDGTLTVDTLLLMLKGIASGMRYLSEKGYIHRDLAARNVLVDEQLVCKIADFGLSRGFENSVDQEYTTNGGKIPVRWTAPEAITYRKFSPASDVWSFGILMWEVCSFGERPYWDWTNQKVINEIQLGYRLPAPMDTPPVVHSVMMECWKTDRYERPNFSQLVSRIDGLLQRPDLIYERKIPNQPFAVTPSPVSTRRQYDRSGTVSRRDLSVGQQQHSQLIEYVNQCGLGHCLPLLVKGGIKSIADLLRSSNSELLAMGLLAEDIATLLRSTLQGRGSATPSTAWGDSSQTLLSSISDTRALGTSTTAEGFFV